MSAGKCFPAWRVVKNWGASQPVHWAGWATPQGCGASTTEQAWPHWHAFWRSAELPQGTLAPVSMNTAANPEDLPLMPASNSQAVGLSHSLAHRLKTFIQLNPGFSERHAPESPLKNDKLVLNLFLLSLVSSACMHVCACVYTCF